MFKTEFIMSWTESENRVIDPYFGRIVPWISKVAKKDKFSNKQVKTELILRTLICKHRQTNSLNTIQLHFMPINDDIWQ